MAQLLETQLPNADGDRNRSQCLVRYFELREVVDVVVKDFGSAKGGKPNEDIKEGAAPYFAHRTRLPQIPSASKTKSRDRASPNQEVVPQ